MFKFDIASNLLETYGVAGIGLLILVFQAVKHIWRNTSKEVIETKTDLASFILIDKLTNEVKRLAEKVQELEARLELKSEMLYDTRRKILNLQTKLSHIPSIHKEIGDILDDSKMGEIER